MKQRLIQLIFFTLFTSLTMLSKAQTRTELIVTTLESYIQNKNIPGLSLSIVTSDTVIFSGGIGYANIEKKEKVTGRHLFRQGSISKSFTALGILKLLQEKQYDLNTPIKDIDNTIPFINEWEDQYPVTIANLLEHTSGFDDFHLHAIYNTNDSIAPPVSKMLLSHQNSLKTRWKPGLKKAYSNPNYIVAGHLMEKLSGQSYSSFLSKHILNPIGMNSSGFYFQKPETSMMSQGYRFDGKENKPIAFTRINGGPAGELCANADDMATYLSFMLNRKTQDGDSLFLSNQLFQRIENAQTSIAAKEGLPNGYGLGNYSIWKNGYLFNGHGGGIDGFSSRYVYSREANIGVAVAINREGDANAIVDEVLRLIIGKKERALLDRVIQPIPKELQEKYAGFYEFNSPRNELLAFSEKMIAGLILDFKNDKLITKSILGKVRDTLYYAGNNQFYQNQEGIPSTILLESDTGERVFWVNENYTVKTSRTKRLILFFGLLISFLIFLSFSLYSLIFLTKTAFSKKKKPITNHLILFGAGISFILMLLGFGLTAEDRINASRVNFNSLLMYLSSWLFIILSFTSLSRYFKLPKKRAFRLYYILASVSSICISIYFWSIGFIGLKLWAY